MLRYFNNFYKRYFLTSISFPPFFKPVFVDNCNNKLGMESGRIPDESITASSAKSDNHASSFARIDNDNAWCSAPQDESPYLEILLDEQKLITAITTQGSPSDLSWARKYEVKYLEKGKWKAYKEVWPNF